MRPQRSTKYRTYRRSKYRYPTRVPNQKGSSATPGHVPALRDIESQLGRKLRDGTKTDHTLGEWRWKEPK